MTSAPVRRALGAVALLAAVSSTLSACDGSGFSSSSSDTSRPSQAASSAAADPVTITTNPAQGATDVGVDTLVKVGAQGGELSTVFVRSKAGPVAGTLAPDKSSWTASARLEPGTRYRIHTVATDGAGQKQENDTLFTTQDLTLDQQTYPSVAPLDGETVGIGMPVVVNFDLPVADKAAFEKHMVVTSTPAQAGAWRWVNDREAHWRPRSYWKAGTKVKVAVDVNSVPAGNGIYGQEDRDIDFSVGAAHIYRVNAKTHRMKVYNDGRLVRTLPITTGKPGFITRSGTKVIMEKFASRRMNSETVGIPQGSSEAYDLDDVKWAMRLTSSGEFIHAAPWSVGSQGRENVSHGCTGMSTADAKWLYDRSRRGDVVEYVGTNRPMTPDNGWGDWNLSFSQYQQGDA